MHVCFFCTSAGWCVWCVFFLHIAVGRVLLRAISRGVPPPFSFVAPSELETNVNMVDDGIASVAMGDYTLAAYTTVRYTMVDYTMADYTTVGYTTVIQWLVILVRFLIMQRLIVKWLITQWLVIQWLII